MVERARIEVVDSRLERELHDEMKKVFAEPLPERTLNVPKIDFSAFEEYAGLIKQHVGQMVKWLEMKAVPFKRELTHEQWSKWREGAKERYGATSTLLRSLDENKFRTNKLAGLGNMVEVMVHILDDGDEQARALAKLMNDTWGDEQAFREEVEAYRDMELEDRIEKIRWFEDKVVTFLQALAQESDRRNEAMAA